MRQRGSRAPGPLESCRTPQRRIALRPGRGTPALCHSSFSGMLPLDKKVKTMRTRSMLLFAGLTAALLLSVAVAAASANRLSISNRQFRAVWRALNLRNTGFGTVNILCPVTMEGSFHSGTIRKVLRALIGYVSRATTVPGACTNGHATVHQESLPWHMQYAGFTGTLPRLSGVVLNLINALFTAENLSNVCTTRTTAAQPARGTALVEAAGRVTGLRADETAPIPLEGEGACFFAGEGVFAGTAAVTLLGNTTAITVTLI
jgi:hypothetical protein